MTALYESKVGSIHNAFAEIKYGEPFPKIGDESKIINRQGVFRIKYQQVGTPEWTSKLSVKVPVQVVIIEVVSLERSTKIKRIGLSLIKNN